MESDGDADKCIYTAEVKTSLYIFCLLYTSDAADE